MVRRLAWGHAVRLVTDRQKTRFCRLCSFTQTLLLSGGPGPGHMEMLISALGLEEFPL